MSAQKLLSFQPRCLVVDKQEGLELENSSSKERTYLRKVHRPVSSQLHLHMSFDLSLVAIVFEVVDAAPSAA
jgi:hypothetical protein